MYWYVFSMVLALCTTLRLWQYVNRRGGNDAKASLHKKSAGDPAFRAYQSNYLVVYLLAVSADWLQGPFVYALYTDYGYDKRVIGQFFIAGFLSSAVFGTFIASIADKFGRRNSVVMYTVLYAICCATKHSPNYWMLLFGRVLAGISTSILFSAFESWMVCEHKARNFDASWISETFARAHFLNGVAAILCGQVAGVFATRFGKVVPFDLAIVDLIVLGAIVLLTWRENYGNERESVSGGFHNAYRAIVTDERIMLTGLVQSLFEAAMYVFVFLWTPALQQLQSEVQNIEIPHGTIFSTFMVAFMIGTCIFDELVCHIRAEKLMRYALVTALTCFLTCTGVHNIWVIFTTLIVFEGVCGFYFPCIGTLRASIIPEETRSAIMNVYRVPLNLLVVVVLWKDLPLNTAWWTCSALLAMSLLCWQRVSMLQAPEPAAPSDVELQENEKVAA